MKISVSYLKNIKGAKEAILDLNKTTADYIHVDVMDGVFVKNNNFNQEEIKEIFANNQKPLDVHLMFANPLGVIPFFQTLNPQIITIPVESENVFESLALLKKANCLIGLSINPDTPLEKLKPYIKEIDLVLVMSVHPGAGGQPFIEQTPQKIEALHNWQENILISVDGGINEKTVKKLKNVDIIVSGSYVCMSDNYEEKINNLRK